MFILSSLALVLDGVSLDLPPWFSFSCTCPADGGAQALLQCGPLVQQAFHTGSTGPRPPIMVHPSIRGHSTSEPGKKGPGSGLFPGVQCRERWWWWLPASDALSRLCSLARDWSAVTDPLILVCLSRNQSLPGKNCRHKLYACIFVLRLGMLAWHF